MKPGKITDIRNKPQILLVEVQGNKVFLKWEKAEGADRYGVARSVNEVGPYSNITTLSYDFNSYTDESIEKEGLYWYKIVAYKNVGADKPLRKAGTPVSANISTMQPPVLLSAEAKNNESVTLKWECSEEVTDFNILRRHDFMKAPIAIERVDKTQTEFVDSDFVKGQLFYYSIQGVINENTDLRYSEASNEICAACMDPVKIMSIKRKLGKKVVFSLRLTSGADGYILYKSDSENGEFTEAVRSKGISEFVLSDKGQKGQKGAFYKVACYKSGDNIEFVGPLSEAVYVKYK